MANIDWFGVANAIRHELFPVLGRKMEEVIESMKLKGLLQVGRVGPNEATQIMNELLKIRRMSNKEVGIMKRIINRAVKSAVQTTSMYKLSSQFFTSWLYKSQDT